MTLETAIESVAENFANRHRNEHFVALFETIAQIIKELRR